MTLEEFIFEYLKAEQDTGAGSYEKMLSHIQSIDWLKVKSSILKLKYFYFLRTSYWQIISQEIKRRSNFRCSCGCRENLQVHHTEEGNDHHGEEHLLIGLVCLCSKCHEGIHDVNIKTAEKKRKRNKKKEEILAQHPYYQDQIPESNISGSSSSLTRKLLEQFEHDRRITIDRNVYEGWFARRT